MMTPQEVRLWLRLRDFKRQGLHFRRQAPFRGYVLDFVCYDRRVVVEVDGGQHGQAQGLARDEVRDAVLRREGFEVLRFWNHEVANNLDGAVETIFRAVSAPSPTRAPAGPTLPTRGRDKIRPPLDREG